MVGSETFRPGGARIAPAERQALLTGIVAFFLLAAVLVSEAANFGASDNGVALQALGAEAVCHVVVHLALCSLPTADAPAGVDTLLGDAGLGQGAVVVNNTFV